MTALIVLLLASIYHVDFAVAEDQVCSDVAYGSCAPEQGRSMLQVQALRTDGKGRRRRAPPLADAKILFTETELNKRNDEKNIEDSWGVKAPRRVLRRSIWQKGLSCTGGDQSSCKECTGDEDCFGSSRTTKALGSYATSSEVKRVQSLVHVRCAHGSLDVEVTIKRFRHGTLRAFWDGEEIQDGASMILKQKGGFRFPIQASKTPRGSTKLSISVSRAGAHEFVLEWIPEWQGGIKKDSMIYLGNVAFFMPDDFASCEDNKVCMDTLAKAKDGDKLRGENALQHQCLSVPFESVPEGTTCREWQACLHDASPETDPDQLKNRLIKLMDAAGVAHPITPTSSTGAKHCIHPPTEDVESWECDCYAEMQSRCDLLSDTSEEMCLRAQWCIDDRVCSAWKDASCISQEIQNIQDSLRESAGALSLSQRASGNLSSSRSLVNGLDDSLSNKHCV